MRYVVKIVNSQDSNSSLFGKAKTNQNYWSHLNKTVYMVL